MVFTTGVFFSRRWWTWISICCHDAEPWRLLLDYSNPTRSLPILSVCRKDSSQSSTGSPWIKNRTAGPQKKTCKIGLSKRHQKRTFQGEHPRVWACTSETNELQFFFLKSISMQKYSTTFFSGWFLLHSLIDSLQNCINQYWFQGQIFKAAKIDGPSEEVHPGRPKKGPGQESSYDQPKLHALLLMDHQFRLVVYLLWFLEPTHLKNMLVQLGIFPKVRGEFDLPPASYLPFLGSVAQKNILKGWLAFGI